MRVTSENPRTFVNYRRFHFRAVSCNRPCKAFIATSESFQLVKCAGFYTLDLQKIVLVQVQHAF